MPIGTVGSDGTLSFTGITPGPHSLQFAARGYEPLKLSSEFTSGQSVTLSSAEVKLVRVPATLDLRADAGTEITIAQAGRVIQQVKAPARISLPEGKYDLTAKGPVGVPTTRPLVVSADAPATIDLRNAIVTGMERFDLAGWTLTDSWSTRRGGNFVLYDRAGSQGTISFTIRMDRSGNPFSSGSRLNWVVGYADSQNYVQLQLDKDAFYRRVVTNGTPQTPTPVQHRIPDNVPVRQPSRAAARESPRPRVCDAGEQLAGAGQLEHRGQRPRGQQARDPRRPVRILPARRRRDRDLELPLLPAGQVAAVGVDFAARLSGSIEPARSEEGLRPMLYSVPKSEIQSIADGLEQDKSIASYINVLPNNITTFDDAITFPKSAFKVMQAASSLNVSLWSIRNYLDAMSERLVECQKVSADYIQTVRTKMPDAVESVLQHAYAEGAKKGSLDVNAKKSLPNQPLPVPQKGGGGATQLANWVAHASRQGYYDYGNRRI